MLMTRPFAFEHCTTSYDPAGTTTPSSNPGTIVGAGANNADTTVSPIISAISHDVHYLVMGIGGFSIATATPRALMDILLDPAGGTTWDTTNVFINDLLCGYTPTITAGVGNQQAWYHFPVYIKSGSSIGARARTSHTAQLNGSIVMYAFGEPNHPSRWWCGQNVESLGVNPASSNGTLVTPGASSAFGSWTTIGTTGGRYGAVQLGTNGLQGADTTLLAMAYRWQIGYGSNQLPGSPSHYESGTTTEAISKSWSAPIFCDIPEGTTMQVRCAASTTGPEGQNAAIYGVMA